MSTLFHTLQEVRVTVSMNSDFISNFILGFKTALETIMDTNKHNIYLKS